MARRPDSLDHQTNGSSDRIVIASEVRKGPQSGNRSDWAESLEPLSLAARSWRRAKELEAEAGLSEALAHSGRSRQLPTRVGGSMRRSTLERAACASSGSSSWQRIWRRGWCRRQVRRKHQPWMCPQTRPTRRIGSQNTSEIARPGRSQYLCRFSAPRPRRPPHRAERVDRLR